MSKQVALTSLSKRFHFTPTSTLSSQSRDCNAPALILLFGWMGANVPHVQKYVNGYAAIWPSTPIILVQSLAHDFRPLSSYAREYGLLKTLVNRYGIDLAKESDGDSVLIVTMSNGGCWSLDALVKQFPPNTVFRPRAIVHDSCPGLGRYSVTLRAFLIAGRYGLFRKAIAAVVITLYYCLSVIGNTLLRRDPINSLHNMLLERVKVQRRTYIYSKDDALIDWRDVEGHARSAERTDDADVKLEEFHGSPHVMHMKSDPERYWRIIQETWSGNTSRESIPAAEPQQESVSIETDEKSLLNESRIQSTTSNNVTSPSILLERGDSDSSAQKDESQSDEEDLENLDPSILGTKEYWDTIYQRERTNFEQNSDDEGEIWFGEESEDRIVEYLTESYPSPSSSSHEARLTVLDLGTGNGHLLFKLYEEGFEAWKMVGIDYSSHSIALAQSIATTRGVSSDDVSFHVEDFLSSSTSSSVNEASDVVRTNEKYDLVLDKGTFDATSLSDARVESGTQRLWEIYPRAVASRMKGDAKLVVTSCNWTKEELVAKMTRDGHLAVFAHFKEPKQVFRFGGREGTLTSQVVFQRVNH